MKDFRNSVRTLPLLFLTSALLFLYGFLMGGQQFVISGIARTFRLSEVGMGALVSAEFAAVIVMPPLMGFIAQRTGNKAVLMTFTLVYCAGCISCGAAPVAALYAVGAFVMGCGHSVCESISSAVVLDLDSVKGLRYMNTLQCALSAGAIISPPLVRFAQEKAGMPWRYLFFFCAGVLFLLFLMMTGMRFPRKPAAESIPARQDRSAADIDRLARDGSTPAEKQKTGKSVQRFPAFRPFLPFLVAIILYVGLECGFGYFAETLFSDGMGSTLGAMGISAYWLGMALSRLVFSAADYRPLKTLRAAFACCAVLLAALSVCPNPAAGVVICALLGAAYGPIWTTLATLAVRTDPGQSSFIMGIMSMGCGAGGVVFPVVMGRLSESFTIGRAFWFLVLTAGICLAVCLGVKNGQETSVSNQ